MQHNASVVTLTSLMHDQSHDKSKVFSISHNSPYNIVCLCVSFVVSIHLIYLLETDTSVVEWLSVSLCIPSFICLFLYEFEVTHSFNFQLFLVFHLHCLLYRYFI